MIGDGMGWVFMIVIMATRIQTRNEAAKDNFDGGWVFVMVIMVMTLQMKCV